MKFIISEDGTITINSTFVRTMYVAEDDASFSDHRTVVKVNAELHNDSTKSEGNYIVTLATFDRGNIKADYEAAKVYLAKLVDAMNGGAR